MPTYSRVTSWSGQNKTAGTTVALSTGMTCAAGDLILVAVGADNNNLNIGTISSLSKPAGETADWTLVEKMEPTPTGAGLGVLGWVYAMVTETAWSNHAITATLSYSTTAKTIISDAWRNTGTGGTLRVLESDQAASGTGITLSCPIKVGEAAWTCVYYEDTGGFGLTPSFDQGDSYAQTSSNAIGTSGGGAASNVYIRVTSLATNEDPNGATADGNATGTVAGADGGTVLLVFGPARVTGTPATGTAAVTLAGSGTAGASAGSTAAVALAATGTARAVAAASAALLLAATGTAAGPGTAATGTAAVTLTGSATAAAQGTAGAALALSATGAPAAPAGGSAALSLAATGAARAVAAGAAAVTLAATGSGQAAAGATATVTLTGAGTPRGVGSGTAAVLLAATGSAGTPGATPATGTATVTLTATSAAAATGAGGATLTLAAAAATAAASTGTANLTVTATGTARAAAAATGTVTLIGGATARAPTSATAALTLTALGSVGGRGTAATLLLLAATGTAADGSVPVPEPAVRPGDTVRPARGSTTVRVPAPGAVRVPRDSLTVKA